MGGGSGGECGLTLKCTWSLEGDLRNGSKAVSEFRIKDQIFLGSSPTHFLCNTFEVYEAFFQVHFGLSIHDRTVGGEFDFVTSTPPPMYNIMHTIPCQICSLHVEWVSIRIFCCPLSASLLPPSICWAIIHEVVWERSSATVLTPPFLSSWINGHFRW